MQGAVTFSHLMIFWETGLVDPLQSLAACFCSLLWGYRCVGCWFLYFGCWPNSFCIFSPFLVANCNDVCCARLEIKKLTRDIVMLYSVVHVCFRKAHEMILGRHPIFEKNEPSSGMWTGLAYEGRAQRHDWFAWRLSSSCYVLARCANSH